MSERQHILVLFASDLHGNVSLYESCLKVVQVRRPSLVLLGGDLLPNWSPRETLLEDQRSFMKSYLIGFLESVRGLDDAIEIGLMLGNEDCQALYEELVSLSRDGLFHVLHGRGFTTSSGWNVLGFNLIPETPFALKDLDRRDHESDPVKYPRVDAFRSTAAGLEKIAPAERLDRHESIAAEMDRLGPMADPRHTIFVSHSPPYDTPMDMMMDGSHVGSRSIRSYIEVSQPLVSLHGHIHESFHRSGKYAFRVGGTVCFNPGQIHPPALDAVLFDTGDPWRCHEHTAGPGFPTRAGLDMLPLRFRDGLQ
jgi:uncharacterized protein